MSWLFGSKKKSTQEEPKIYVETIGDYSVVSTYRSPVGPLYPTADLPPVPYPVTPLSPGPSAQTYHHKPATPSNPYQPAQQHSQYNPLESIPFKLSPEVDRVVGSVTTRSELMVIRLLLDRIKQDISRNNYDYNFNLEKSIMREASV